MRIAALALAFAALSLTACAAGGPDYKNMRGYGQGSGKRLDGSALRAYANPSEVAATDIAFARAARDEGQWTAFRRFAADGAVIHGRNGVIEADPWLAQQSDPKVPVQWTPVAVWSSCDGSAAITQGKFAEPDGQWGYYVTVWERQSDGRYRWVYDMGAPDDELTASQNAKRDSTPTGDNVIVIEAIEAIEGKVADCSQKYGKNAIVDLGPDVTGGGSASSDDNTLTWGWTHSADGSRALIVQHARDGKMERAFLFSVGADGKHIFR